MKRPTIITVFIKCKSKSQWQVNHHQWAKILPTERNKWWIGLRTKISMGLPHHKGAQLPHNTNHFQ